MMKLLLGLLLIISLLPQLAWAGKVYRWMDAQGNVHFSSTPGPNQSAGNYQGHAENNTRPAPQLDVEDIFTGTWHGSSRTLSVRLDFLKKSNMLRWAGRPRGGGIAAENFTAKWAYVNSDLELLYVSYQQQPEQNGKKASVKIIEKSADSLLLQFADGRVFKLYKRLKRRHLEQSERMFVGKWELDDKNKSLWSLSSRGFNIQAIPHGQYNYQMRANGNWKVDGDILMLTHINDRYIWKPSKTAGTVERFKVLLREQGKIILQDMTSQQQLVLVRKK